jgi:hypothetical protein
MPRLKLLPLLLAALLGCGGDGNVAPVSGTVKLNGKPVAGVEVMFQPVASEGVNVPGAAAVGVTDTEGRFTAKLIGEQKPGATVGKNQVMFSGRAAAEDFSEDGTKRGKPAVAIPPRYSLDSKIFFEVPRDGTATADFDLTSP